MLSDPQRRQAYDMFGKAGVNGAGGDPGFGAGFGSFGDIFDAFFGGRRPAVPRHGRPPAGRDLRYDLRITFAEAVSGTEKDIEFPVLDRCQTCAGSGAKEGTSATTCPQCSGRGEVRTVRQTMLGQMVNVSRLPPLPRRGPDRRAAVRDVQGRRTGRAAAEAPGDHPGRASTRATRSASPARARPGRAAGRRAASTSRSTWRPTRS